eukprot:c6827_g1_i2.p1 GENE.c6827_g1_i2~~c6827_g1_i2.p1  ORF type:complete len:404 (+),score=75.58 c6827_g1_i2:88-1212(+)
MAASRTICSAPPPPPPLSSSSPILCSCHVTFTVSDSQRNAAPLVPMRGSVTDWRGHLYCDVSPTAALLWRGTLSPFNHVFTSLYSQGNFSEIPEEIAFECVGVTCKVFVAAFAMSDELLIVHASDLNKGDAIHFHNISEAWQSIGGSEPFDAIVVQSFSIIRSASEPSFAPHSRWLLYENASGILCLRRFHCLPPIHLNSFNAVFDQRQASYSNVPFECSFELPSRPLAGRRSLTTESAGEQSIQLPDRIFEMPKKEHSSEELLRQKKIAMARRRARAKNARVEPKRAPPSVKTTIQTLLERCRGKSGARNGDHLKWQIESNRKRPPRSLQQRLNPMHTLDRPAPLHAGRLLKLETKLASLAPSDEYATLSFAI